LSFDGREDSHTARRPRHLPILVPVHVVNRGVDKRKIFVQAADYEAFLGSLAEPASRDKVDVFAYIVMVNHVPAGFSLRRRRARPHRRAAAADRGCCDPAV